MAANLMTPAKPKIVLVDDHPEVLKSLCRMLSLDFDVAGSATDGYQAIDVCERCDPDVVLLDITMVRPTAHDRITPRTSTG